MNIININSNIDITPSQKSFIEEVLLIGNNSSIKEKDSFYWLSKDVPVLLLTKIVC